MPHIDDGHLESWLDRPRSGMSAADAASVESHLEECAECRNRVDASRAVRARAAGILAGAGPVAIDPPPFETIAARASRPRRPQRIRPFVAAAWAASVVAAVGLGWFSRELLRTEQIALQESLSEPAIVAVGDRAASSDAVLAPEPAPGIGAASTESADATAEADVPAPAGAAAAAPAEPARLPAIGMVALGQVTDAAGQPLPNAQVTVAGTGAGALTGPDGRYSLEVARATPAAPLTIAAQRLGFAEATATLLETGDDTIAADFQLPLASLALDDIVVTGSQRRSIGAISPSAAGAPPPPPPPPSAVAADAAVIQGGTGATAGTGWRFTTREHAEDLLGRAIVLVPDLPLLRVQVRPSGNGVVVRVVQEVTPAGELILDQSRADARAARPEAQAGNTLVNARRGDLVIDAQGALDAAALRRLVDAAR